MTATQQVVEVKLLAVMKDTQEGDETETKDIHPDVPDLNTIASSNGRFRCYSKSSESYVVDEDVRVITLEEPPPSPKVEIRFRRTQPRVLHVKWEVEWSVEAPMSNRVLINIKERADSPTLLGPIAEDV
nr:unnamed protein product [Haemonchus contortus]